MLTHLLHSNEITPDSIDRVAGCLAWCWVTELSGCWSQLPGEERSEGGIYAWDLIISVTPRGLQVSSVNTAAMYMPK